MPLQVIQEYKRRNYHDLNKTVIKGQTLFTGSSLMEFFPVNELCMSHGNTDVIYNRGIAGLTTTTFLECIDDVLLDLQPGRVFINIGTNDIGTTENWETSLEENYRTILSKAVSGIPGMKLTLMAYYPVNEKVIKENPLPDGRTYPRTAEKVNKANEIVKKLAGEFNAEYIDVNEGLSDPNGQLKDEFTADGIHMYAAGYEIVYKNLAEYL